PTALYTLSYTTLFRSAHASHGLPSAEELGDLLAPFLAPPLVDRVGMHDLVLEVVVVAQDRRILDLRVAQRRERARVAPGGLGVEIGRASCRASAQLSV